MFTIKESYEDAFINAVWQKATMVVGYNSSLIRKDACGAWIYRSEYGNVNSQYGWEIDHIKPVAKGGLTIISNLQPLQWGNNRHKSDDFPNWSCRIKSA